MNSVKRDGASVGVRLDGGTIGVECDRVRDLQLVDELSERTMVGGFAYYVDPVRQAEQALQALAANDRLILDEA